MRGVAVNSYAKINLSLDVLGLTDDGYHRVSMVMQQIMLHDDVLVRLIPSAERRDDGMRIELSCNRPYLPRDERNLAYRAAALMAGRYGGRHDLRDGLIRIDIKKRVPVGAGLAGGSGNAAAVIHALNKLWHLRLPVSELMAIGSELGSDVPFCIMGQAKCNPSLERYLRSDKASGCAALAEGRGTLLSPVPALRSYIVLVKPSFGVSTREVYEAIDREIEAAEQHCDIRRPDKDELISGLRENNRDKITANMINLLELYTLKAYPRVAEIKEILQKETEAAAVLMSGSGPTVYGLYFDREKAHSAYRRVRNLSRQTFITTTAY